MQTDRLNLSEHAGRFGEAPLPLSNVDAVTICDVPIPTSSRLRRFVAKWVMRI